MCWRCMITPASKACCGPSATTGSNWRPWNWNSPTWKKSSSPSCAGSETTMTGFSTLFYKEILRFWKVSFQTILAPVLTALLYLLQNAFANSSSSLIQSKITGNIVFILLPPLSHLEFFGAYVLASAVRGAVVGLGVFVITALFVQVPVESPLWVVAFALLGSAILGTLGIIAGIWADKFDQLAAFQNFVIIPLTFLSGVFYSIHSRSEEHTSELQSLAY